MGQRSCSRSPVDTETQTVLYHAQKQNLRSPSRGSGEARARGDRQGHVWCDPSASDGGSSCCIIKRQPEVVPTILSLSQPISDSLFTLQPVHISKLCSHQSLTPSPYEEISDQLALIRAVFVSSIIFVSLPCAQKWVYVYKYICMHKCTLTQTPNLGQQLLSLHSNAAAETSLSINAVLCPSVYSKGTRKGKTHFHQIESILASL